MLSESWTTLSPDTAYNKREFGIIRARLFIDQGSIGTPTIIDGNNFGMEYIRIGTSIAAILCLQYLQVWH